MHMYGTVSVREYILYIRGATLLYLHLAFVVRVRIRVRGYCYMQLTVKTQKAIQEIKETGRDAMMNIL